MQHTLTWLCFAASLFGGLHRATADESTLKWFKGNLHTHSFWSDGNDFPEMIVAWYKERGYQFLALTDHNILSRGEKWIDAEKHAGGAVQTALPKYRAKFGSAWIEEKQEGDKKLVRLKTLAEFRGRFEEPGKFLLIEAEEITDRYKQFPVHLNASNLRALIRPQGGKSVFDVMQRNVNAVIAQRESTGQPILIHINHPNFGWGIVAEDIARLRGERFFEVYNGHPGVRNYGDATHPSMERMWDIVLTLRLVRPDGEILFGLATDDSHQYHRYGVGRVNPGRGWVMVRAASLEPNVIIAAIEKGRFYSSSGVELDSINATHAGLSFKIKAEPGVQYTTQFIGTEFGYDPTSKPADVEEPKAGSPPPYVTRRYSKDIGKVLSETTSTSPSYRFTGREIYVRATVRSSKLHPNPYAEGDTEMAWIQPVIPPGN